MANRNILISLFILLAGWGFTANSNDAKPSASIHFQKAQQTLTMADEARDLENLTSAMELYQEALISYSKLSTSYPNWQPGVTQFRIAYCNNQLEALHRKIEESTPSLTAPEQNTMPTPGKLTAEITPSIKPAEYAATRTTPDNPMTEEIARPQVEGTPVGANARPPYKTEGIPEIFIEAKLLLEKGDIEKARSTLLNGLRVEPDDRNMRMLMGIIHCRANEFENAIYLSESLVQEDSSNAIARVILGTAYFGLGRIQDATKQMQEALTINPKLAEAHYNLAQILLTVKPADTNMARNHYKSALELGSKPDAKLNYLLFEPVNGK